MKCEKNEMFFFIVYLIKMIKALVNGKIKLKVNHTGGFLPKKRF